ncbi:MAG: putative phage tail protein [Candidatus Ornithomonoglobus sp.]
MINRLPGYYRKSKVLADLYFVIKNMLDKAALNIDTQSLRLFITTTDEFTRHESDVGLSSIDDTDENRKSRVITRLQGNNVLTLAELETLISNYEPTGCTIDENFADYTVYITFSGRKGIPENIELIKAAVEEVKPAHLKIEYVYCENTWTDISEQFGAWGNISENMTWEMLMYYNGKTLIYVDENNIPYFSDSKANSYVIFIDGAAYARRM